MSRKPKDTETLKELPKLPYGMGSYLYYRGKIVYKKTCKYNGEEKRIQVTGNTIPEVNKLMREKERDWQKSVDEHIPTSGIQLLQDAIKEWLVLYKKTELKERSYDRLEDTFNNYINDTDLGRTAEDHVTSDRIQLHLNKLKKKSNGEPLSYSSVKKIYELLGQFFKYRYLRSPNNNPMLGVPKPNKEKIDKSVNTAKGIVTVKEEMTILNDDEMERLTRVAYKPYEIGRGGYIRGLGIAFMMWTFLRSGEARALRWGDIDFEKEILNVERQVSNIKNRDEDTNYRKKYIHIIDSTKYNSARTFKIPKVAMDIAKEFKRRINPGTDDEYFLANSAYKPITETAIRDVLDRMLIAADINKHLRIHDLRHTGISYMLRHKVPVEVVSKMAGHKEIETTYRVYYQVLEEQKTNAIDKLNEEFYKNLNS